MQFPRKLLLAALALTLAACAAPVGAAPVSPEPPGGKLEADKWLVNDAELVVIVNVRQMLGSALMKKGGTDGLKGLLAKNEQARAVLEATGIDPLKDIDAIVTSGTVASAKDVKARVVVRGKFNLAKIHAAAEKFARKHPTEFKVLAKEGTVQPYQIKADSQTLFAAFADSSTLVAAPSKEATVDAVKNAGRAPAKVHKDIQASLAKLTGKESISLVLVVNDEMKKAIGRLPQVADIAPKLETVTGAISLSDAATTALAVHTSDPKAAAKLLQVLNQVKNLAELVAPNNEEFGPIAGELLKAMKLSTNKGSVTLDLKVTPDMIEKAGKKDK
jgi:hypothetical protein